MSELRLWLFLSLRIFMSLNELNVVGKVLFGVLIERKFLEQNFSILFQSREAFVQIFSNAFTLSFSCLALTAWVNDEFSE